MRGAEQEVVLARRMSLQGLRLSWEGSLSVSCSYTLLFVSLLSLRQQQEQRGLSHYVDEPLSIFWSHAGKL